MLRLLYGVQATGNGHISRARALLRALAPFPVHIDFLFSGRPAAQLFEMSAFGHYQWRRGLTFVSQAGQLCYRQTWQQADLRQLWRDIRQLDTRAYDLVITDFEPVTAWAARLQGTPVVGLGHQYAFHGLSGPVGMNFWQRQLLKWYAPAQIRIGLHWHHFDQQPTPQQVILPPIVDLTVPPATALRNDRPAVLVYLPFEQQTDVLSWLSPLSEFHFEIYGVAVPAQAPAHLKFCPPSLVGFKQALHQASAVISNAGFELISEALQLHKAVLVKPLKGQSEQESNAAALQLLGLAQSCPLLSATAIRLFLQQRQPPRHVHYPDVAAAIAGWLAAGNHADASALTALWQHSEVRHPVSSAGPVPQAAR